MILSEDNDQADDYDGLNPGVWIWPAISAAVTIAAFLVYLWRT